MPTPPATVPNASAPAIEAVRALTLADLLPKTPGGQVEPRYLPVLRELQEDAARFEDPQLRYQVLGKAQTLGMDVERFNTQVNALQRESEEYFRDRQTLEHEGGVAMKKTTFLASAIAVAGVAAGFLIGKWKGIKNTANQLTLGGLSGIASGIIGAIFISKHFQQPVYARKESLESVKADLVGKEGMIEGGFIQEYGHRLIDARRLEMEAAAAPQTPAPQTTLAPIPTIQENPAISTVPAAQDTSTPNDHAPAAQDTSTPNDHAVPGTPAQTMAPSQQAAHAARLTPPGGHPRRSGKRPPRIPPRPRRQQDITRLPYLYAGALKPQKSESGRIDADFPGNHGQIENSGFPAQFAYENYHGFLKARLPDKMLESILAPRKVNADDIQIEIGHVTTDLTDQIHHHNDATAYVIVLGGKHGYSDPKDAYIYINNAWRPLQEGDAIKIPAKMRHGFTVAEKGELYFLTVQSPLSSGNKARMTTNCTSACPWQGTSGPAPAQWNPAPKRN